MATWRGIHGLSDQPLFIKFNISKSGYSVHLTDLSRVWAEDLSRREVIRRAVVDGCSVDPTESDDQYGILLDKIKEGLSQAPETNLAIYKGEEDDQLSIHLTVQLPRPLPPFQWVLHLPFQTGHSVADELVMPLLKHTSDLRRQIKQLVHELAVKDSVIFKITDRLENSGQDLSLVFPNVSNLKISRKRSQREQFSPHVKGLAEFDFATWQTNQKAHDKGHLDANVVNNVFQDLPPAEDDHAKVTWWANLPKTGDLATPVPNAIPFKAMPGSKAQEAPKSFKSSISEDETTLDDFQKQSTPPQFRSSIRESTPEATESFKRNANARLSGEQVHTDSGEETASEDETDNLDNTLPKKPRLDNQEVDREDLLVQATKIPSRIKAFDPINDSNRTAVSGQRCYSNGFTQQLDDENPGDEDSTNFGGGEEMGRTAKDILLQDSTRKRILTKPKPKLGTLGGKFKATPSTYSAEPLEQPAITKQDTKKLGKIGGKGDDRIRGRDDFTAQITNADDQPLEVSRGRSKSLQREEERQTERETSQERADRKREELRKKIEVKAKAPAKKKRKF